jgi:hypothetical protein
MSLGGGASGIPKQKIKRSGRSGWIGCNGLKSEGAELAYFSCFCLNSSSSFDLMASVGSGL